MKKGYLLLSILALLTIFAIMVSAGGTVTSPSAGATISGSVVSVAATLNGNNTNCGINVSSDLSANFSIMAISKANITNSNNSWAVSLNTIPFNDASDYKITFNCTNNTNPAGDSVSVTGIVINNRVPDVPTDVTSASLSSGTFTVQATVVDKNTTSCNLGFNGQSPISEPTCSLTAVGGTNCSCVFTNAPDYKYDYFIYASDGRDNTASPMGTITVSSLNSQAGHSGKYIVSPEQLQQAQIQQQSNNVGFIDTIINGFKSLMNKLFG